MTEDDLLRPRHQKYFHHAAQMATLSLFKKFPMGCVVVYKNKVVSTGINRNRTDPLQKKYNKYRHIPNDSNHMIHCEVDALKRMKHWDIDWNLVSIYIVRLRKITQYGLAYPCPACHRLIKDLGIKHIYYTTNYGFAREIVI